MFPMKTSDVETLPQVLVKPFCWLCDPSSSTQSNDAKLGGENLVKYTTQLYIQYSTEPKLNLQIIFHYLR